MQRRRKRWSISRERCQKTCCWLESQCPVNGQLHNSLGLFAWRPVGDTSSRKTCRNVLKMKSSHQIIDEFPLSVRTLWTPYNDPPRQSGSRRSFNSILCAFCKNRFCANLENESGQREKKALAASCRIALMRRASGARQQRKIGLSARCCWLLYGFWGGQMERPPNRRQDIN